MYWFIQGSFVFLADCFPDMFKSGGDAVAMRNTLDHQLRLLDSLAQHDVTKKDEIRRSPLFDVLYALDEQMKIAEERERRIEEQKSRN